MGRDQATLNETADSSIERSRRRSIELHHIDPGNNCAPRVLPAGALREHRQPMEPLLDVARSAMETLFLQIRDAGYVILLTDANGVAVDFINNPVLDRELRRAGLYLGGCWSERDEGTCAVGLAAVDRRPVTVHHAEHFRALNGKLTCSAAPILAPDGRLLAMLDASALNSPDDKRSQHLVLQMVEATARLVENASFLQQYERHLVLRLGSRREFLEVVTEGLIALDGGGHIVAANQRFLHDSGQRAEALAGEHFEAVFGTRFDEVNAAASQAAPAPVALRLLHSGSQCFALPRGPRRSAATRIQRQHDDSASRCSSAKSLAALAGGDSRMAANVERALRVLDKGLAVLLQGESGTGKEVFAKAMHDASARAGAPFIALNCAAIPETLIEAELFGYRDGAFTGARAKGARGKIAQAHGGTLFLDEIGDMPLAMQTRLLRALAEREVTPLGAEQPVAVDLQVICATHCGLNEMVAGGQFRLDLYYRLNGLTLQLPPLRERTDKAALLDAMLRAEALQAGQNAPPPITASARALLLGYHWPGNIRQLKNAMRASLALADGEPIGIEHLPADISGATGAAPPASRPASFGCNDARPAPAEAEAQRDLLLCALRAQHWNVTLAARSLGVCRATVYRHMERYGIVAPNRRD